MFRASLSKLFAIITSKNFLLISFANFIFSLKLKQATPPNALIGSHLNADLKLSILFGLIDTPDGFPCFTITVPLFFW